VAVYKEFTLLCEQYVRAAQRLGELQREVAVWDKAAKVEQAREVARSVETAQRAGGPGPSRPEPPAQSDSAILAIPASSLLEAQERFEPPEARSRFPYTRIPLHASLPWSLLLRPAVAECIHVTHFFS